MGCGACHAAARNARINDMLRVLRNAAAYVFSLLRGAANVLPRLVAGSRSQHNAWVAATLTAALLRAWRLFVACAPHCVTPATLRAAYRWVRWLTPTAVAHLIPRSGCCYSFFAIPHAACQPRYSLRRACAPTYNASPYLLAVAYHAHTRAAPYRM